jgi:hypothetical protein
MENKNSKLLENIMNTTDNLNEEFFDPFGDTPPTTVGVSNRS